MLPDDGASNKSTCSTSDVQAGLVGHGCIPKDYTHIVAEHEGLLSTNVARSMHLQYSYSLYKAVTYKLGTEKGDDPHVQQTLVNDCGQHRFVSKLTLKPVTQTCGQPRQVLMCFIIDAVEPCMLHHIVSEHLCLQALIMAEALLQLCQLLIFAHSTDCSS